MARSILTVIDFEAAFNFACQAPVQRRSNASAFAGVKRWVGYREPVILPAVVYRGKTAFGAGLPRWFSGPGKWLNGRPTCRGQKLGCEIVFRQESLR